MKNKIGYSALALGLAGTIYTMTQPKPSFSPKDRKNNIIAAYSLGLLGLAGGILVVAGWKTREA